MVMSMHGTLYIPDTITIGFQPRGDTYTNKLGYVIYTDEKGKLRKEASWQSWRDHNIAPVTFNNTAQQGFTFNKGVQRDGHWGSGRSVIRVYDQRDFEFEISIDNLIGILMHADVSKRDITEPCVFAWSGTELILLPTNSVEYQESLQHTAKQHQKFSARDLVVGYTYSIKKNNDKVVYLGRFDRYNIETLRDPASSQGYFVSIGTQQSSKKTKKHAFYNLKYKQIEIKEPMSYISHVEVEDVHPQHAEMMDMYYQYAESQPIIGAKVVCTPTPPHHCLWMALNDTEFVSLSLTDRDAVSFSGFARWNSITNTLEKSHNGSNSYSRISPHVLDGLSIRDPVIATKVDAINNRYLYLMGPDRKGDDYQTRGRRRDETISTIAADFNLGLLQFVLSDGKLAKNHQQ
jgi:hypothetical protein